MTDYGKLADELEHMAGVYPYFAARRSTLRSAADALREAERRIPVGADALYAEQLLAVLCATLTSIDRTFREPGNTPRLIARQWVEGILEHACRTVESNRGGDCTCLPLPDGRNDVCPSHGLAALGRSTETKESEGTNG